MALSTDDRLAILDVAARYNHAFDSGDGPGFADCWAEDGIFEFVTRHTRRGRAELMAMPQTPEGRGWTARHWTNNAVIEGSGDSATMRLYVMVWRIEREEQKAIFSGVYHDRLRCIDGAWKFVHRRLTPDIP